MSREHRRTRSAMSAALWVTVLCALGQLPAEQFPPIWILAFSLPALVLLHSSRLPWIGFWPRLLLAAAAQVGAAYGALHLAGELGRPAALACTLLPPLVYVAARRQEADVLLALFLSFCMLLVGVMLHGGPDLPILCGYVLAAGLTLRLETRWSTLLDRSLRLHGPPAWRSRTRTGTVVAACGVAAFGFTKILSLLPVPGTETERAAASRGSRSASVGLSDRFNLDAAVGTPLDLRSNRLVRVRTLDREGIPGDLYLRSGFFDVPGLDGWSMAPFASDNRDLSRQYLRLRRPVPNVARHGLEIERLLAMRGTVFTPPGTYLITGLPDLDAEPARMWLRQTDLDAMHAYGVEYQDLRGLPANRPADARWIRAGLTRLPPDLDLSLLEELARDWDIGKRGSPLEIAESIAGELQKRCAYALQEPVGPHEHALLNFLHGNRQGYCMHFASATAILLRMAGVPCRIGVGLYGGEPDPKASGARVYGSQHAHAWVEIPYPGMGWVVFDPTPPAARAAGALVPGAPDRDAVGGEGDEAGPVSGLVGLLDRLVDALSRAWVWGLLLASWCLFAFRPGRVRKQRSQAVAPQARPARRHLRLVLRELARRGRPRSRGQTLEQYLAQLRTSVDLPVDPLASAFAAYQEVRFGARPYDEPRRQRLAAALSTARSIKNGD